MTDQPRQYEATDLDQITLGDAFLIKSKTGVDVFKPQTQLHRHMALLWHAAHKTDEPLLWKDLESKTAAELAELVADEPEPDVDDDEDSTGTHEEVSEVEGKASTNSDPS